MTRVKKKRWIPKIPKKRIKELAKRIKPVVRFARGANGLFESSEGHLFHIKPVDLFGIAYTWDPKPTDKATGLKRLCDIRTYHTYGYYGFFKPSIAEVLAQIPTEHLTEVVAFEIVESPETAGDLNREHEALNAGYHVATTRLYVRR
ncbi:MAG: hypothetical protein HY452_00830 [Parcubacteria group bacterium]|nr:hypothetical protein [Parcubacteria group bacterium]